MDINDLKSDPVAREDGTWVDNIPGCGDLRLRVRGANCRAHQRLQAKLIRELPVGKRTPVLDPDEATRIDRECMVSVILLEWENMRRGGERIPYSPELARSMVFDEKYEPFRDAVEYAALRAARIRLDDEEATLGN